MILWLGGRVADAELLRMLEEGGMPFFISSFATIDSRKLKTIDPARFRFFLDSGAFSAWTRGTALDLDEYCAFIKSHADYIDVYAALDVIGGSRELGATARQRIAAGEQSWANYLRMRDEGLDPLPVYHYGDPFTNLTRMVDAGCTYIGIGGLVGVSTEMRRVWLDRMFGYLKHHPHVRTHGFGMSSAPLLARYPWYSADAGSWIQVGMHGAVFLPAMRGNEFVFDLAPATVYISHNSTKAKTATIAHVNSMSPAMLKILDRWLEQCGTTLATVQESYYARAVTNIRYYKALQQSKGSA